MRSDAEKRLAHFVELISQIVENKDAGTFVERNGATWAAMAQSAWCDELGFTPRTLRTLAKCPPVRSQRVKHSCGGTMVLYRLTKADEGKPVKAIADKMAAYWKGKLNKKVTPREYGCLIGLAEVWPTGIEFDLFKLAVEEWKEFCVGVKYAEPEAALIRFYEFPCIPLMRRYPEVAFEMHAMHLQANQQWPSLKPIKMAGLVA